MMRVLPIVLVLALLFYSASASSCEWGERECQALSDSQTGCEGEVPQLSQVGIDASLPQRGIGVGGRMALAIGIPISSASANVQSSETT
jgi:hypothetical protein